MIINLHENMWPGRVSNQRPLDSQPDSLPNTNTEYLIETKTLYARLQHSFYTICNETKTKTDKYRGTICIDHTRLTIYYIRPLQYDCTSRWLYALVLVALRSVLVTGREYTCIFTFYTLPWRWTACKFQKRRKKEEEMR